MKKNVLISTCISCFLLAGCSYDSVLKPTKYEAPKAVSTEDFIYAETDTVTIPATKAGKEAYLITYNNATSSSERMLNNEEVDYSKMDHIPYYLEVRDIPALAENVSRVSVADDGPNYDNLDTSVFFIGLDGKNEKKSFVKKATGNNCNVWYSQEANKSFINLQQEDFELLAEKFDDIYSREEKIFGDRVPKKYYSNTLSHSACKRKVNILLFDIKDDATENQTSGTYGFFDPKDFYLRKGNDNPSNYKPYSNLTECLYLDSHFFAYEKTRNDLISTIAHEFQHLLYFVNKHLNYNVDDITWCSEMLSMLAEEIFQDTLKLDDMDSPKARLRFFKYGSNFGFTDDVWTYCYSKNISGTFEYANTYAFGSYLLHKYGIKVIKNIATNIYDGIDSFTHAIPGEDTFDTEFYRFGRFYVEGILPAINTEGYELDEIDLRDTRWQVENTEIASFHNINLSEYTDTTNPLIWNKVPDVELMSQGFIVQYLGEISPLGETYSRIKLDDPDYARFILLK